VTQISWVRLRRGCLVVDAVAPPVAAVVPSDAGHEQVLVAGVDVANRGGNREANGLRVERARTRSAYGDSSATRSPTRMPPSAITSK
jgi:hypothetical protein